MSAMAAEWSALCIGILIFGCIDSMVGLSCSDSIESLDLCRALVGVGTKPKLFNRECTLPNIANTRLVYESDRKNELIPGETVPHLSLIVYQCKQRYSRVGPRFNLCDNGNWHEKTHAICTKLCQSKDITGISFKAACIRNGHTVSCDDPIMPQTLARITCRKYFIKREPRETDTLVCLEDGYWDHPASRCNPECGDLVTRNTPFIDNGTTINFVPWHVAIYKKKDDKQIYECSGTILSTTHIVSAATCFVDRRSNVIYDKSLFTVGAGKHLGHYDANDPKAQFRNVQLILIHPDFGDDDLKTDIALLVLESPLEFTRLIGPICFDLVDSADRDINARTEGYVINLENEKTDLGTHPKIIKMITSDCENSELLGLKFCAPDECKDNCKSLLGSGFTLEKNVNGTIKHILWGIQSVSKHSLTTFTNVRRQHTFIKSNVYKHSLK